MSDRVKEQEIIDALSYLIMLAKRKVGAEERFPAQTGDQMDAYIYRHRGRAERLSQLRTSLEEVFAETCAGEFPDQYDKFTHGKLSGVTLGRMTVDQNFSGFGESED